MGVLLTFDNLQLSQSQNHRTKVSTEINSAINCTAEMGSLQLIAHDPNAQKFLHASLSENTRRGYRADLEHFMSWGGSIPASPEKVSLYLAHQAEILSPATLSRRVVAIGRAHTSQGLESPTKSDLVKATLRGIRRSVGISQRQVAPAVKEQLISMAEKAQGVKGLRDRAVLLVGFAGAFRRSELVAINCTDLEFAEQGLIITINRSKTDQEGRGRKVAIPYARGAVCPVTSLKEWLSISGINEGPVFRPINRHKGIQASRLSTQAVAEIVKQYARAVGLDHSNYSGHSLRAGLVTSAALAGVSSWKIRQQTGHKSDAMLTRYIRDSQLFVNNAVGAVL